MECVLSKISARLLISGLISTSLDLNALLRWGRHRDCEFEFLVEFTQPWNTDPYIEGSDGVTGCRGFCASVACAPSKAVRLQVNSCGSCAALVIAPFLKNMSTHPKHGLWLSVRFLVIFLLQLLIPCLVFLYSCVQAAMALLRACAAGFFTMSAMRLCVFAQHQMTIFSCAVLFVTNLLRWRAKQ